MGLSDRRQAAICSCNAAICARIAVDGAAVGASAANTPLPATTSRTPMIEAATPRVDLEMHMTDSFTLGPRDRDDRVGDAPTHACDP